MRSHDFLYRRLFNLKNKNTLNTRSLSSIVLFSCLFTYYNLPLHDIYFCFTLLHLCLTFTVTKYLPPVLTTKTIPLLTHQDFLTLLLSTPEPFLPVLEQRSWKRHDDRTNLNSLSFLHSWAWTILSPLSPTIRVDPVTISTSLSIDRRFICTFHLPWTTIKLMHRIHFNRSTSDNYLELFPLK